MRAAAPGKTIKMHKNPISFCLLFLGGRRSSVTRLTAFGRQGQREAILLIRTSSQAVHRGTQVRRRVGLGSEVALRVEQEHRWVRVSVQSGWVQGRLIQRKVSHGRRRFFCCCFNVTSFLFNPLHAVLFFQDTGRQCSSLFSSLRCQRDNIPVEFFSVCKGSHFVSKRK